MQVNQARLETPELLPLLLDYFLLLILLNCPIQHPVHHRFSDKRADYYVNQCDRGHPVLEILQGKCESKESASVVLADQHCGFEVAVH